jgi:hypothetical protein
MGADTRTNTGAVTSSGGRVTFDYLDPSGKVLSTYDVTVDKNGDVR